MTTLFRFSIAPFDEEQTISRERNPQLIAEWLNAICFFWRLREMDLCHEAILAGLHSGVTHWEIWEILKACREKNGGE